MNVTDTLKNATYVTIGFGVLGFQKLQVRRQELAKQVAEQRRQLSEQRHGLAKQLSEQWPQVEAQLAEGRRTVSSLAAQLDGYVVPVRAQVETGLDNFEAVLPPPVQEFVGQARSVLSEQEQALRSRLGLPAIARAA